MASAASKQDEAKSLVKKAVAYLKENGNDKAFAEFNNPSGKFTKGELYIFVNNAAGAAVAHGGNQKLIGKNMFNLKDSEGKLFIQEIAKVSKQGGGWTEYKWTNPASKKIETKMTYVEPVGDLAVGCGFYK
jgi:signal transduction histidine kinase